MGYFKLIFLFLLFPGIVHASFDSGADMVFMEMGSTLITDTTSLKDVYLINVYGASLHGKLNLKNYTIYGKVYLGPIFYSQFILFHIDRLYGAAEFGNMEITIGKQYFNTGYGRIFKINNLMGNTYSPFNISESGGKIGVSAMYYTSNNIFNIRGGTFTNASSNPYSNNVMVSRFSDNTYVLEEELNFDEYGLKLGQFYNFKNIDRKYLFSLSLNADLICGLNMELQTFSDKMKSDLFSYRGSISVDYTIPIGNGLYADLEFLYKQDSLIHVFSSDYVSGFLDRGHKIMAFQMSYPFNLSFKTVAFVLYNMERKNYNVGGMLTIGKQLFYTDLIVLYKNYHNTPSSTIRGSIAAGCMFRLSL